jgi:hypothetical protein
MPLNRSSVFCTLLQRLPSAGFLTRVFETRFGCAACEQACGDAKDRVKYLEIELQATREKCLPGNTALLRNL